MHTRKRLSSLLSTATVITATMAGAGSAETVLEVGFLQDLRGTQPGVTRDGQTDTIHMHIVEGLVAYASDFLVKPMLTESYTVSDDGLTYTFKLRQGVKFHNGDEMTSENVKWSWDYFMNPDVGWRCLPDFNGDSNTEVLSVETPDDYTVVYTLSGRSSTFLSNLARFDCGSTPVLHQDSVDENGKWVEPIGTGPFTLGENKSGQYFDLLAFQDYVSRDDEADGYAGRKEALIDRVRFNILPESSVSKTAFLGGDLDVIIVDAEDVKEVEAAQGVNVQSVETAIWDALVMNVNDPLLSDVRMRQAIAHAIDREQMMEVITGGRGKGNPSPVPRMSSFYTEVQETGLPYDPEKSKALLEEIGYNGEPLMITTNRRSGNYYERALIAQSMLTQAGINAKLEVLEWGTQLDQYYNGKYQIQSFAFSARLDPALSFDMLAGTETRKVFKNEKAIALVADALVEPDREKRQQLIDELHVLFSQWVPAYSVGHRTQFYGTQDRVKGFEGWGAAKEIYWNVSVED